MGERKRKEEEGIEQKIDQKDGEGDRSEEEEKSIV